MTLLYVPCVAAVAAFRRETGSWKWTFFMIAYTTLVGYGGAVLVYQEAVSSASGKEKHFPAPFPARGKGAFFFLFLPGLVE